MKKMRVTEHRGTTHTIDKDTWEERAADRGNTKTRSLDAWRAHCERMCDDLDQQQSTRVVEAKYEALGIRGRCAHLDGRAPGKEDADGMALVIE
jgi:hypothetical protein